MPSLERYSAKPPACLPIATPEDIPMKEMKGMQCKESKDTNRKKRREKKKKEKKRTKKKRKEERRRELETARMRIHEVKQCGK